MGEIFWQVILFLLGISNITFSLSVNIIYTSKILLIIVHAFIRYSSTFLILEYLLSKIASLLTDISKFKNNSDKFLILALFEGVRTEEAGELFQAKISKLNGNILTFENGEKRVLSKELIELAIASSQEEEYISFTGAALALKMEGNIVNSRNNVRSNIMENLNLRLTNRLIALRREMNMPYLTIPRLYTAGIVDQFRRIMKKYGVSKEEIFEEQYVKMVSSNYGINSYSKRILKSKFYNYL